MRIVSNFMDDIIIQEGKYHALTFESSYIQSQFRKLLLANFSKKHFGDSEYLYVLNENDQKVNINDYYFLYFDCNIINLYEQRTTTQSIQTLLKFQLENNADLIQEYEIFNQYLNNFTSKIEFTSDDLTIGFSVSENSITQFIKSLEVSFEYKENEYVPNHLMRKFLIQAMLRMNVNEKTPFLLISFPETDVGSSDYVNFIEILKKLNVTTLVITTQPKFLTEARIENMYLINNIGKIYDVIRLKDELIAFNMTKVDEVSMIAKNLAIRDFSKDYILLDKEKEAFLKSNEF